MCEPVGVGSGVREVGAFAARDSFGQLLDLVEQGEQVTITRRGKAIAHLAPFPTTPDRQQAWAANQRIRARARAQKFGRFDWAEWKAYRDEGRP